MMETLCLLIVMEVYLEVWDEYKNVLGLNHTSHVGIEHLQ